MKLTGGAVQAFLKSPDPAVRAVLVYGPDEGLVRERLERLLAHVVEDPKDPFRVSDLTAGMLKEDPARLADEAAALSLTGGRRVVRLRGVGDADAARLKGFVKEPVGEALVLVQGGDLGPRSSLRQLFESAPQAVALPCYADEGQTLETVIRDMLSQAGVATDPGAVEFLTDHLGGDRGVTRSEIAKVITYCGTGGRVSLADAEACVGDSARLGLEDLAYAIGDGEGPMAVRTLTRVRREGVSGVAILRGVSRHMIRLHQVAAGVAAGQSLDKAIASLAPPVIFKRRTRFRTQAEAWSIRMLGQALDLLGEAELELKRTGLPEDVVVERVVLRLVRAGASRGRRR